MQNELRRFTGPAVSILSVVTFMLLAFGPASSMLLACGPASSMLLACGPASRGDSPTGPSVTAPTGTAMPDPSTTVAQSKSSAAVTVTRTGGLLGVTQEVTIAPDGSWVFTDKQTGMTERGQFTADQVRRLATLAADPALLAEARRSIPPAQCADGYVYAVSARKVSFTFEECGDTANRPLTTALLNLLLDATPM
jgi:hypothetical protein